MPDWLWRIRQVIWTAVAAVTTGIVSVVAATIFNASLDVTIPLSSLAAVFALLSQRQ